MFIMDWDEVYGRCPNCGAMADRFDTLDGYCMDCREEDKIDITDQAE